MKKPDATSQEIAEYWDRHPVGADYVRSSDDWAEYFRAYDRRRYATEAHIPEELARLEVRGKRVLEIGTGQGTESERLVADGADYYGADLTAESLRRLQLRFGVFGLPALCCARMNAEQLAFADATFDVVFSHGVLHHSPRIAAIVAEIGRVLRPGGTAVVMVYHRSSLNYHISIRVLRRLGLLLLYLPGIVPLVSRLTGEPRERLRKHLAGFEREGLAYLRMQRFLHASTDGPENVYSAVFTRADARRLFASFADVRTRVHHLNERHFPLLRAVLPARARAWLASRYGWHLWIYARKPDGTAAGSALRAQADGV